MPEPFITATILGQACVTGLIGNRTDWAALKGAKTLGRILRLGSPQQNHYILRATQSAYVAAMRDMADACVALALSPAEREAARTLKALVGRDAFTDFRFDGEHFPMDEANAAIDRMFSGGIAAIDGGGPVDAQHAFGRAVVADLAVWGVALEPDQARLFEHGLGEHAAWHLRFRIAFGEVLITDPKALTIFTQERLGEIRAQGIELIDAVEALHARFDRLDDGQAAMMAMLRDIRDNQAAGSEPASLQLLQSFADGYGEGRAEDLEGLKRYLLQKIEQWRDYRTRIEALEGEGNRDAALLADARAATDRGDFATADALLAEAEEAIDEKLDPLLIAKSERRALRGDNAKLAGDYAAAVAFYDEAAALLPASARDAFAARRWSAADAMLDWGERFSDPHLLPDTIARWRDLAKLFDRDTQDEGWASVQNKLGYALRTLGDRQEGRTGLDAAVAAHSAALEVYTRDGFPREWAQTMNYIGNALLNLGYRQEGTTSLDAAIRAYQMALQVYTYDQMPFHWAMTRCHLGGAQQAKGERQEGTVALDAAVEDFNRALDVYTRERTPFEWAATQNNLGNTLSTLGERQEGTAALEAAVAAFKAALEVHTRERMPFQWAATHNNLGGALSSLGERQARPAVLDAALAAYTAALEVRTRERLPLGWAMTQGNIGNALISKARKTRDCETARDAVRAYNAALEIFAHPDLAWHRANVELGLAKAQALVAELCA